MIDPAVHGKGGGEGDSNLGPGCDNRPFQPLGPAIGSIA